jgi:Glycosyl transferase family 11
VIIARLDGGLGNQMFQYAAGRSLSLHHHVPLYLDTTILEKDPAGAWTPRKYVLDCFKIQSLKATEEQLTHFSGSSSRLSRIIDRTFPSLRKKLSFSEPGYYFYKSFFRLPADTLLIGCWQSEKYFKSFDKLIRSELSLKSTPPPEIKIMEELIQSLYSVSIHVRRGDYVSLKICNELHGLCSLQYYERAHAILQAENKDSRFFIFSDDPEWCRQNLQHLKNSHLVCHPFGAEWDLYLMSLCKSHIIANSSFSWWGAWLCEYPGKRVLVPEYWLRNASIARAPDIKTACLDVVAEGWEIITET